MPDRIGTCARTTGETTATVTVNLDGSGSARIATGVGFLDHMLDLFAHHGLFDLDLEVRGDLHVDAHHTVEDAGLALGAALLQALGERRGVFDGHGHALAGRGVGDVDGIADQHGAARGIARRVPAMQRVQVRSFG